MHEPHSDYFYHMANDYQGSILGKDCPKSHLDNQPPCDFFLWGSCLASHNWVNFRFIAFFFFFSTPVGDYDLGIMRADRVRYGQVVISHFMKKKIKQGSISNYEFLDFAVLGVFH